MNRIPAYPSLMKILLLLSGALLYSTLSACLTVEGIKSLPLSEGTTLIVEAPLQRALILAKDTVLECGLNVEDEVSHHSNWVIVADHPMYFMSWGQRVRVVGEPNNGGQTLIRVLAKNKSTLGVDFTSYPQKFQKCIVQTIELKTLKEKASAPH